MNHIMKLKRKKLKWIILISLMGSCTSLVGMPVAFAETLNIITQDDYNSAKDVNGSIYPTNSTSNNVVTIGSIGNGTVPAFDVDTGVYGGYSKDNGTSNNNMVTINGGDLSNTGVYGGYSGDNGVSNNNSITINGSSLSTVFGGYGNRGSADNNVITINGGNVTEELIGGFVVLYDKSIINRNFDVYDNAVTIRGGNETAASGIAGGAINIDDQSIINGNLNVYNNAVIITDGAISSGIAGGAISIYGDSTNVGTDNISNNTVNIMGGTIAGFIAGGAVSIGNGSHIDTIDIKNNTVTINPTNNVDISAATLYGSAILTGTDDNYSIALTHDQDSNGNQLGNTLNVYGKGITAKNVVNFSNINFYLPSSIQNQDTALTLTDTAGTDISYSTVKAGVVGNANLNKGDKIYLLTNANGLTTMGTTYGKLTEGVSLDYDLNVYRDGNSIVAAIDSSGEGLKYQTKSLVETRAAAMGFLNSGMNLASDMGIRHAVVSAEDSYTPFVVASGNIMRYDTGSYVDVRGYNTILGFSRKYGRHDGALYVAPFIEAGWGRYTSHLDNITADGSTDYYGLGILARRQRDNGLYYEGSLHYGRMNSTYNSGDLIGVNKEYYNLGTPYYGMYLGIGKEKKLDNTHELDVYGKYYYTRQNGDTATITSGETYNFDEVTSNRVRIGTRYTRAFNNDHKLYAGIAYEYEFSGSADATYKGYTTPESSLKGGSGMMEVGYEILSSKNKSTSLDLSLTGWIGKQKGLIPNATVKWYF